MYKQLSKKLYELFVLNNKTLAIQMPDGKYIAKKVNYDYRLFEKMLEKKSSLGVYQQQYYRDVLKWICVDFDCKQDVSNLKILINEYIIPFLENLDNLKIHYLKEFSGRRGIHIWIHFNTIIPKADGYKIVQKLIEPFKDKIKLDERFDVDLFPATDTTHNKYGKSVKIPLSNHKKGGFSYFIKDLNDFSVKQLDSIDDKVIIEQMEILNEYKYNAIEDVMLATGLDTNESAKELNFKYKRVFTILGRHLSIEELENASQKCQVLQELFKRIRNGNMSYLDRRIIVGTFVHIDDEGKLLQEIFKLQSNYNEIITEININKLKRKYYPPTLSFLYDVYNENMEDELDPNQTTLEYLLKNAEIPYNTQELEKAIGQPDQGSFIDSIVEKEKKYFLSNDEVIDIAIYNDLFNFYQYDKNKIIEKMEEVFTGTWRECKINSFKKYVRIEQNGKERDMVSLCANDRILTTALMIELTKAINYKFHSYSYNVNRWEDGDIFFPWFHSWRKFQKDVSIYFILDLFEDYCFMKIDFSSFYDSIYLHAVYEQMQNVIKEKTKHTDKAFFILEYLSEYNEKLMKEMNGQIRGVPQGPAYARVVAELFLATVLQEFFDKYADKDKECNLYRYVDDVYIIYNEEIDGNKLLCDLESYVESKGLKLNPQKTRNYGRIKEMTAFEKTEIREWGSLNYEIRSVENLELEEEEEREEKIDLFEQFLHRKNIWDINDANFILNTYIDMNFIKLYIERYFDNLVKADYGRGSIFNKFYEIVLLDNEVRKKFFEERKYERIPFKTLNLKNFLNTLYFNLDKILIQKENISFVKDSIEYFKKKECLLEYDEQTTLDAIQLHVIREEGEVVI